MPRPLKYPKRKVVEALHKSGGILADTARVLKVDRKTVQNYLSRWPDLEQVRLEARENIKDLAESHLVKLIKSGTPSAIFFFLKCQAKERGYIERAEVTGKDGGAIETSLTPSQKAAVPQLSDDDLAKLAQGVVPHGFGGAGTPTPSS